MYIMVQDYFAECRATTLKHRLCFHLIHVHRIQSKINTNFYDIVHRNEDKQVKRLVWRLIEIIMS